MKDKNAFSLVELIVGMTISMILMAGVGILVSGGIANIVLQEKVMQNIGDFRAFSKDSLGLFSRINTKIEPKILTSTSALIRVKQDYEKLGVSFIGEKVKDSFFCSGSEVDSSLTKHIIIKNFLPFEEIGEDIFNNFSSSLNAKSSNFQSFYKSHRITDNSLNLIVGKKGIFGDKLGEFGTGTRLNNPTGLAYDSIKKNLYISDTGNNRILVYNNDSSSPDYKKISKLLDEKDGLNEPMGLAFDSNRLFIVNSGLGEILEYSSISYTNNPKLTLNGITKNDINKFELEFLNGSINLTDPDNLSDFVFNPDIKNSDDFVKIDDINKNKLKYYFIKSLNSESNQSDCSVGNGGKYVINSSDFPVKCSNSEVGTGQLANLKNTNFLDQKIEISNIKPLFTDSESYYIKASLYNNNNLKQEKHFPYFTQGDDDLLTKNDNVLRVILNNFDYPTGIKYSAGNLEINDFFKRKKYTIDLKGTISGISNLGDFDYSEITFDEQYDYILATPIDDLDIKYDLVNKYLNLNLKYYKDYNCYDEDKKIKRTFILSKNYK